MEMNHFTLPTDGDYNKGAHVHFRNHTSISERTKVRVYPELLRTALQIRNTTLKSGYRLVLASMTMQSPASKSMKITKPENS
jgi:hypothetical protein